MTHPVMPVERLTSAEMRTMALDELGRAMNDATDAILRITHWLTDANFAVVDAKVAVRNALDPLEQRAAKDRLDHAKAVYENLKIRKSGLKSLLSGLQTTVRSLPA